MSLQPEPLFPEQAVEALLAWFARDHRQLPWRETRDPYRILVSEIMLQQTQADRVVPKYHDFLERFPSAAALADAPASEVIRAWAGLGYNRRALNLQRACQAVMEQFGGEFPQTVEELRTLPGVGPYTAGAIACFAFEADVGFVDTNIRRVLHRVLLGPELPVPLVKDREIARIAELNVPAGRGYFWNQALIELGATACRARSTDCLLCPVRDWCASSGMMAELFVQARSVVREPQVPFEQTSRYFRGRIIDRLREASLDGLTAGELALAIDTNRTVESPPWTTIYLAGLIRDGLVVAGDTQLREDSPGYDASGRPDDLRYRLPD